MRKTLLKRLFALVLLAAAALCVSHGMVLPKAAEAKKIKVEVEVDDDDSKSSKKPAPKQAPATFPATFVNKSGSQASVALLYYDVNAKDWRCQGWWNVKANSKKSIKLCHAAGKNIYYYVEKGGRVVSKTGTSNGLNWVITKQAFSYLYCKGKMPKLDKPYKAHFVRCATDDGWFKLNIN